MRVLRFLFENFGTLAIYVLVDHFWGLKAALIVSMLWALGEVVWLKARKRELTFFFKFSVGVTFLFGTIDLYATQPLFLKIEATLTNLAFAWLFGRTLWSEKSIVQEFAERQGRVSKEPSADKTYFFRFLTAAWTIYFVAKGLLYLWINFRYPFGEALFLRVAIGKGSFWAMMFASAGLAKPLWRWMERARWLPSARVPADRF